MVLLYNIFIRVFYLLALIFSTFNHKAKLWLVGRKGWEKSLRSTIDSGKPTAWFHCASLGEFEQGRPLVEAYREKHPSHKILITFFSPSGYLIRKGYKGADYVHYLPLDTKKNAQKFLSIVKPKVVVFIKYEFWYHFLNELKNRAIPTYLVSAIFRPQQVFFKWYGKWNRKMLLCFNHIFVQNTDSKILLSSIGLKNVTIAGDTRFDRVYATSKKAEHLPLVESFCKDSTILVAGSTWPKDEELLLDYIKTAPENLKIIIAPHEISQERITEIAQKLPFPSIRYTNPNNSDLVLSRVLFLDTIGLLASAYRYGNIAYVGGGFGVGIHNTLEPATFGIPILFGPNYSKFNEAVEMIRIGAAFSIKNSSELLATLNQLLNNSEVLNRSGHNAAEFIKKNVGATEKVISYMDKVQDL